MSTSSDKSIDDIFAAEFGAESFAPTDFDMHVNKRGNDNEAKARRHPRRLEQSPSKPVNDDAPKASPPENDAAVGGEELPEGMTPRMVKALNRISPELLNQEVEFAVGANRSALLWKTETLKVGTLLYRLMTFRSGPKDGVAITQGSLCTPQACARESQYAVRNTLLMLDHDAGHGLDFDAIKISERRANTGRGAAPETDDDATWRRFKAVCWKHFNAADYVLAHGEDPVEKGDRVEAVCPNKDAHSTEDSHGTLYVINPENATNSAKIPAVGCNHAGCKDIKGTEFVRMIMLANDHTVEDLLEFVSEEGRTAWESASQLPRGFFVRDNRVFSTSRRNNDEFEEIEVCASFDVVALSQNEHTSDWGKVVNFTTKAGDKKEVFVPDGMIAGDGAKVRELLASEGLWIGTKRIARDKFSELLNNYTSSRILRSVQKPGWYGLGTDDAVFVAPNGDVIAAMTDGENSDVYRLADGRGVKDREKKGSFDAWKSDVAAKLWHKQTPHLALGLLTGNAGTVVQLLGEDTCGIHWGGPSSRGKSTAQIIGASTWANPKSDQGILFSCRTTTNGLEFLFQTGNGTSVHLDEVRTGDNKVVADLGFFAAGGGGKTRMRSDTTRRDTAAWTTFLTVSSERSLKHLIESTGRGMLSGDSVRIAEVNIGELSPIDPREAKAIKDSARANYGWAGPEFARAIVKLGYQRNPEALKSRLDDCEGRLISDNTEPTTTRAARIFATLWAVGEIMLEAGIIPAPVSVADVERVVRWGWDSYLSSDTAKALNAAAASADALITWLHTSPGHVRKVDDDRPYGGETLAFYDADKVYIPTEHIGRLPPLTTGADVVLAELERRGLLERASAKNRAHNKKIPNRGKLPHYILNIKLKDNSEEDGGPAHGTDAGLYFRNGV